MNEDLKRPLYHATLDRAGLALATGGALGGLVAMLLVFAGGERDPLPLLSGLIVGALASIFIITAIGAPLWLVLHLSGSRRAWHAAAIGGGIATALFVAGQAAGFGPFGSTGAGAASVYRWISALATSALLGLVAAAIALAMWRVAYRRR